MKQSQTTGLGAAENTRMITVYCNYIRIDISTHLIQLPIRSPTWRKTRLQKSDYRQSSFCSRGNLLLSSKFAVGGRLKSEFRILYNVVENPCVEHPCYNTTPYYQTDDDVGNKTDTVPESPSSPFDLGTTEEERREKWRERPFRRRAARTFFARLFACWHN